MNRGNFIGVPEAFNLSLSCESIHSAYPESIGIFLVGSALEKRDFRDVDIRMILKDEDFHRRFPNYCRGHMNDSHWILTCAAISEWLASKTKLPIDFQIQEMTEANKLHSGKRQAIFLIKPM